MENNHEEAKTGLLFNSNNIKIARQYFREAVRLIGIYVLYRAPKTDKQYTLHAELDSAYEEPKLIGCIFHEHPDVKTMRKLGWASDLQSNSSLIEVDYDLEGLQQGAMFIIPSAIDNTIGRLFRVVNMQTSMLYPASITCEVVPEYTSNFDSTKTTDFENTSYNLLNREDNEQDIEIVEDI